MDLEVRNSHFFRSVEFDEAHTSGDVVTAHRENKVSRSATYSYYLDDAENRYYIIDLEEQTIMYIKNPAEYLVKVKTN